MTIQKPGRRFAWLLGLLLAAVAVPAAAYILPGYFLFRKFSERLVQSGVNAAVCEINAALPGPGGQPVSAPGRLTMARAERLRLDVELPGGPWIWARNADHLMMEGPGRPGRTRAILIDPVTALLAGPSAQPRYLEQTFAHHGVKFEERSLVRHEGRIAIAVGARAGDRNAPQVWMDKDRFVPVRVLWTDEDGAANDMLMRGWGATGFGDWIPREIEWIRNGALEWRISVLACETGGEPAAELFPAHRRIRGIEAVPATGAAAAGPE
ncbi:MAG: hypothetical protein GMKNLPBB_02650 [Myxococcota bacterium]|nr:hypothetical protein [Myxococcota bacterium]